MFSGGSRKSWENCQIGITGANGALGKALTKKLRDKGAIITGFTHSPIKQKRSSEEGPNYLVQWECGKEDSLYSSLSNLDILILNHGINPRENLSKGINQAIEINALSTWRLIEIFEKIVLKDSSINSRHREVWINTSEAEMQPALSPAYEISKRLIGQLASLKWATLNNEQRKKFTIRKIILGPFKSNLNPIGIMDPEWVASRIIILANLRFRLIIITPNPLTYFLIPLNELSKNIYYLLFK